MKATLYIDGVKTPIGYESLESVVEHLDDTKAHKKIYEKLVTSNLWRVKEIVSKRRHLTKKMVKSLLKNKRHGLTTNLLENPTARTLLTTKNVLKIFKRDNPLHFEIVGKNLTEFIKCNQKKIIKKILNHEDPRVRKSLVGFHMEDRLDKKTIKRLIHDKDCDVASYVRCYV